MDASGAEGPPAPMILAMLDRIEDLAELREATTAAIEAGADGIVVTEGAVDALRSLARVRLFSLSEDALLEEGRQIGCLVRIGSQRDVDRAIELLRRGQLVLLETPDWSIIPMEDLVAARHGEGLTGRSVAVVGSLAEAQVALGALEHGVEGIAARPASAHDAGALVRGVLKASAGEVPLPLTVGTVVRVQQLGLGDRACVDTVDLLTEGEGLLVGSSSAGFLLVHGETIENPYAAVRPFRVNAGAVHSYVIAPGGRTMYLSEAESGITVLLVDRGGQTRPSHVGRLKIERRPLVLVEVEAGGQVFNAILQNAETVRLVTPAGHASVSSLEEGQKVIVYLPSGPSAAPGASGRHFGRAVPERILES